MTGSSGWINLIVDGGIRTIPRVAIRLGCRTESAAQLLSTTSLTANNAPMVDKT